MVQLSSAGLPYPPPPTQPKVATSPSVQTTTTNPQTAYTYFEGRTINAGGRVGVFGETTGERLQRLKREIEEIEVEVSRGKNSSSSDVVQGEGKEDYKNIVEGLKKRLDEVTTNYGDKGIEKLTTSIDKDYQSVKAAKSTALGDVNGGGSEVGEGGVHGGGEGSVVYELFVGKGGGDEDDVLRTLEERVGAIEALLPPAKAGAKTTSLVKRVEEMEEILGRLDEGSLRRSREQARIIRGDLEAAGKLKKSIKGGITEEDRKMLKNLYEQFISLDGLTDELPRIVERMVDLNDLHQDAEGFRGRVEGVEGKVKEIRMIVDNCEKCIKGVEEGMGEMLENVRKNVEILKKK